MTNSYKIALLSAALLCALVVGYYAMPDRDNVRPANGDAAEEADADAAERRSLVRGQGDAAEGERASRPGGDGPAGDAMAPFDDPALTYRDEPDSDASLPPAEDPGLPEPAADPEEPSIPVARDGGLESNPFAAMDVDRVEDRGPSRAEARPSEPDEADEADEPNFTAARSEPDPEPERETEPEPAPAPASEPATAEAPADEPETYTVQSGDTLSSIAEDLYGAERHWVDLARANPRVDPIRLRIGQELRLPDRETIERRSAGSGEADLESPPGTLTHVVRPGDSLSTIAQQHYNDSSRWRIIFNANRDKLGDDPNRVTAGDELTIPPLPRN